MDQNLLKAKSYQLARQAVALAYRHIKDDLPVAESVNDGIVTTTNTITILTAATIYVAVRDNTSLPRPAASKKNGGKPVRKPVKSDQ